MADAVELPKGTSLILEAAREFDRSAEEVAEIERARAASISEWDARLVQAQAKRIAARTRLDKLGAHLGSVVEDEARGVVSVADAIGLEVVSVEAPESQPTYEYELPDDLAKTWRLGFMLLDEPRLDYAKAARALYGKGIVQTVGKNRLNSLLTHLKTTGVAKSLGGSLFQIDVDLLAKLSGVHIIIRLEAAS